MLNLLRKAKDEAPEVIDLELAELEREAAEVGTLHQKFSTLRNAVGTAEALRKQQQQRVERLRTDGQALLEVNEEQFAEEERVLRERLRSEARERNAFDAFVQEHPDLERRRTDLGEWRQRWERNHTLRELEDDYFKTVQPAVANAYRVLIAHEIRKDELLRRFPNLTIAVLGIHVDPAPYAAQAQPSFEDVEAYLRLERLYHRREEPAPGENTRAFRMLQEAEAQGPHKVTKPKWTW